MLKDEIIEILDLLNKYNIPEESQRELFEKGLPYSEIAEINEAKNTAIAIPNVSKTLESLNKKTIFICI